MKTLKLEDDRSCALDWWNKLPMFNMDYPCKRMLAAKHYETEQSLLTLEQIENIWKMECMLNFK